MTTTSPTVELAVRILSAYVMRNVLPASRLPTLLAEVHRSIAGLEGACAPAPERPSAAQIRASIRPDTLLSFEDGKRYKTLRRHLTLRGLTPEAYRSKWGLPLDYPMVSADYSARRSKISREISQGQRVGRAAGPPGPAPVWLV